MNAVLVLIAIALVSLFFIAVISTVEAIKSIDFNK